MDAKWLIFTVIAMASASRNYESSGKFSWQGSDRYATGLPSVNVARSSADGWLNSDNALRRYSSRNGADANGWSGIYRYGINRSIDGYSEQGWNNGRNLNSGFGNNEHNVNWADPSNEIASRSTGGWSASNAKSALNSWGPSSGW